MMEGHYMIRVENVRIVETNKNYKDIFHALFLLDYMVSGGTMAFVRDFEITDMDINIINDLFVNKNMVSLDKYIGMTVKSFIKNKKHIGINMYGISGIKNKKFVGFLMEDEVASKRTNNIDYDNVGFKDNLMSSKIFDIFPSTTHITIEHGARNADKYVFDLFIFLEIICKSDKWKIIKIKEKVKEMLKNTSWLYSYYHKCSSSLETEYQKHGLTIQFDSETVTSNNKITFVEYLKICRM